MKKKISIFDFTIKKNEKKKNVNCAAAKFMHNIVIDKNVRKVFDDASRKKKRLIFSCNHNTTNHWSVKSLE